MIVAEYRRLIAKEITRTWEHDGNVRRKLSKFYAVGRGPGGADRKKALLLHCAGMDVYVDVTYMLLICHSSYRNG